ncbi:hypothetical protein [Umezawaea beigongshangensis]|uniref:hypothetical protein n=1 Tax=Umezawaea beigongshangensis TaxID=2780383 RepID=UPI0018F1B92D|nr:hypothetical protein [Umezawaea beigongshangensis]
MRTDLKSPALVHLCRALAGRPLDEIGDEDLYGHLVHALRQQHAGGYFEAQRAPELDGLADAVLARLVRGWFTNPALRSPQAWFTDDPLIRPFRAGDGSLGSVLGEKPAHALWTSSFLPSGLSAWEWGERAEFGPGRRLHALHFTEASAVVFTIDSARDHADLVTRYPRPAPGGLAHVAWSDVARDFHAVRLTARGLVLAEHVDVATPHGIARLRGWDSESTAWLSPPPDAHVVPVD